MLKFALIAAGLCALTAIAPASAQDAAADQCRAAAGHVKVFDGRDGGTLAQAPRGSEAHYDALHKIEGVPGESKDNVRTARELGSRAAVGRRMRGGIRVATGDVDGDGAGAMRAKCQNNLKQISLGQH